MKEDKPESGTLPLTAHLATMYLLQAINRRLGHVLLLQRISAGLRVFYAISALR